MLFTLQRDECSPTLKREQRAPSQTLARPETLCVSFVRLMLFVLIRYTFSRELKGSVEGFTQQVMQTTMM